MDLAKNGLIGKIWLTSMMTEEMIFDEIWSVFRGPMNGNTEFLFEVLQPMGGTSKCLAIPSLSNSIKWTASAIVPKNAKSPLYILAKEPLVKIGTCVWTYTGIILNCMSKLYWLLSVILMGLIVWN